MTHSASEKPLPRWLERLLGWPGFALAFAWGFAEGTLFFVVPDVAFTLTTALRPRQGLAQLGAVVAGASLAGTMMYGWSASNQAQARNTVAAVPYVGQTMLEATDRRFEQQGAPAMFDQPLGGVPYKVYAVLAPSHLSPVKFLLLSIPARVERLILSWLPFALLSLALRRAGANGWRAAVAVHSLFWIAVYAYYWGAV